MSLAISSYDWMERGNCARTNDRRFFSDSGSTAQADQNAVRKEFCNSCPVKTECLNYAIDNRIDNGVWGGASERERRRIRKNRARGTRSS